MTTDRQRKLFFGALRAALGCVALSKERAAAFAETAYLSPWLSIHSRTTAPARADEDPQCKISLDRDEGRVFSFGHMFGAAEASLCWALGRI